MINIIGGKKKRTKLSVPNHFVRPTSSIKREAIFSILESYSIKNSEKLYENKCFVDLFAGSGSLGLEAISRGAKFSYFFENNKSVLKNLEENCSKISSLGSYKIIDEDITLSKFDKINMPVSTIFIDPPYNMNPFKVVLNNMKDKKTVDLKTKIVIESHKKLELDILDDFKVFNEKIFGKSKITFIKLNKF